MSATVPRSEAGSSRRGFLKGAAGALALSAGLGAGLGDLASPASATTLGRRNSRGSFPIKHVIVDCQENRSFDHYYGYAPWIGRYGVPTHYSQPDGHGGKVRPFHLPKPVSPDVGHDWATIHREWDFGEMDGFYTADGRQALGYYTKQDLPFYYSLFDTSTLCVNYFCSMLGPTYPNRFYLVGGTSGGITTNGVYGYGVLDYPIILDLLEDAGVSWKVYNIGFDNVPQGYSDNVFVFFKRWAHDPRTRASKQDYFDDLRRGALPQVSFVIPSYSRGWDEHPPADIRVGMRIQKELITALRNSSAWPRSAYVLTYDENGGYFDHVAPPEFDAYGAGIRVPTWVISPYAKKRHLEPAVHEHASILKLLETLFGLPTLASVNHRFDESTPGGPNNEAAGGYPFGPAAPPRDRLDVVGNLMECFTF
ncbi:MAG: phospholipase C [Nocardioidaceae bacterium]